MPVWEANTIRGTRIPFGAGKRRPVILATRMGPDAVLFPRSTKQGSGFMHDAHRHDPPQPSCKIDRPGWVILRFQALVDHRFLNEGTYSCEEPDDSPLLDAIRRASRP